MHKGLTGLIILCLLVGTAGRAAISLTGITYTYPAVSGQDPQVQDQDPENNKLTDGKFAIGGPGAVWTAWNWPQATVLFDLGQLPAESLINKIVIRTSEDFAHQHLGLVEVFTSPTKESFHHVATIQNPEGKLTEDPSSKRVYSFGTEFLHLQSRYLLMVFHKDPNANNLIIEEVEFWAEEPQKIPFSYTYPLADEQDPNILNQDLELMKLIDGGKGWGGSTAIYGSWGSARKIIVNIDFGRNVSLKEVALWTSEDNANQHLGSFQLYGSADGETFSFLAEITNPEPPLEAGGKRKVYSFGTELLDQTRYIKLICSRDSRSQQQVIDEVEFSGYSLPPQLTKQLPAATIGKVEVNTYSSVKVDLGDYLVGHSQFTSCRVYLGEDFFNDAKERLAYHNWWWLDEKKQVLLIAGLTPGQEYYLAVGGETPDGRSSRCLKTVSVQLPEVMATQKVGDVFGINAFPYFAPGGAHKPRTSEEEEVMFRQQIQWIKEARISYNRWWTLDERGIKPYLNVGTTFLIWLSSDPERIRKANRLGVWLFASPNEPNLGGLTPQEFMAQLQEGYQALKAANLQNILAAPVVHGIEAENWLRGFYQAGGKEYFDVFDIHMYQQKSLPVPEGLPAGSPEGVLLQLDRLRQIMTEFGDENKPIIVTETGCPTYSGNYWAAGSTPQGQANFTVRSHLHLIASGVKRIFWYALQDEGTDPDEMEENFGLIDYYGDPKPAYWAYKTMVEQLGETVYTGVLPGLANPHWGYVFEKISGHGYVSCLWDATGRSKAKFRLPDGQVLIVQRDGARQVLANPTGVLEVEISEAPLYIHSSRPLEVIGIER